MKKLHQHYIRGRSTPILLIDQVDKYMLVKADNEPSYFVVDKEDNVYANAYLPGEDKYEQLAIDVVNQKPIDADLLHQQRSYQFFKKFLNNNGLDTIL